MEYRNLGRTGLKISRLGLGTVNFGFQTKEPEAWTIMDRALEAGINFIDTSNHYGAEIRPGLSEEIIGRWLAQGNGRRQNIVLATKVHNPMGPGANERGLSAYHIRRACEDSLRRLQTDHVDLYQMHHVDRSTPWEEIWQAMEQLVQQGKILYVGSSNFAAWHIVQAQCLASARHFMGLVSEQSVYNLACRTIELEVIPACRACGLAVLPWSPVAAGLLAGPPKRPAEGRRVVDAVRLVAEKHRSQLEAYEGLCRELGEEPAAVALAWVLANQNVTAPIIGPRTIDQLMNCIHAQEMPLPLSVLHRLDAIWPGPGGEAPEAYAW